MKFIKDVNPGELPRVQFADRQNLPPQSGVYFVVSRDGIVSYVGKSCNIRHRWKGHHVLGRITSGHGFFIAYLLCDTKLLGDLEGYFYEKYKPALNERLPSCRAKLSTGRLPVVGHKAKPSLEREFRNRDTLKAFSRIREVAKEGLDLCFEQVQGEKRLKFVTTAHDLRQLMFTLYSSPLGATLHDWKAYDQRVLAPYIVRPEQWRDTLLTSFKGLISECDQALKVEDNTIDISNVGNALFHANLAAKSADQGWHCTNPQSGPTR